MLKEGMVEELARELSERPNLFVTSVNRLTGSDASALRQKLGASQARFVMVKRRIGLRTLARLKLSEVGELVGGSVAFVVTSDDALPIAKELTEFIKAHENQLTVRGAWIDGQLLDSGRVEALAKLPSKPILLAQVVGSIESPLQAVISTVERLIGDLAYAIEQVATKVGTPPPGASPKATVGPLGRAAGGGVDKGVPEGAAEGPAHKPVEPEPTAQAAEPGTPPEPKTEAPQTAPPEGTPEQPQSTPETEQGQSRAEPDQGPSKPEEEKGS